MNILLLIEHKKKLIELYKNNNFFFIGNIFNNDLQIIYINNTINQREIIIKYYNILDIEIDNINNNNLINELFNRLKLKFKTQIFSYIYVNSNYITLYNNKYKVKFFMQDSYGEFINPIILSNNEIKKLILYQLQLQL